MSFTDILSAPLPSKRNDSSFFEGSDDMTMDVDKELKSLTEGCKTEGSEFDDEDDGLGDFSDLLTDGDNGDDSADPGEEGEIDSQLADIEGLLNAGNGEDPAEECGSCSEETQECGDPEDSTDDNKIDPTVAASVDDPTPAPPLEGDADQDADNMMAIVATPMLLADTLTTEEAIDFLESGDMDIAVSEDLLLEEACDEMVQDLFGSGDQAYTESVFASPNRPYKMTKKARFNQLYELSLQIEARAHHDPFVPRLDKAYKIERTIKAGWRKRYGALATRRAKNYLKRLMHSNSKGLKKAATRLIGNNK